jgi:hypothetical protein
MSEAEVISLADGKLKSSKIPALHLIPYQATVRLAARFEAGQSKYGEDAANITNPEKWAAAISSREFVIHRIAHAEFHLRKLSAILTGQIPDDGDDHAGAVIWGSAFLCAAFPDGNKFAPTEATPVPEPPKKRGRPAGSANKKAAESPAPSIDDLNPEGGAPMPEAYHAVAAESIEEPWADESETSDT